MTKDKKKKRRIDKMHRMTMRDEERLTRKEKERDRGNK